MINLIKITLLGTWILELHLTKIPSGTLGNAGLFSIKGISYMQNMKFIMALLTYK